jgi:hypothetical protein
MSEEWRRLPEFPKYEITSDGDIRNRETRKVINETQNQKTGAWSYCLWRNDGTSTHRAYEGLLYSAWPELNPGPEWVVIPGYPTHVINRKGEVKNKRTRKIAKQSVLTMHLELGPFVTIKSVSEGGWHSLLINDLVRDLFPDQTKKLDEAA